MFLSHAFLLMSCFAKLNIQSDWAPSTTGFAANSTTSIDQKANDWVSLELNYSLTLADHQLGVWPYNRNHPTGDTSCCSSLGWYYLDFLTLPSFEVVEKMITDFRLFLVELGEQVQQDREAAVVLLHLTQVPEDQTHRLTHGLLQWPAHTEQPISLFIKKNEQ